MVIMRIKWVNVTYYELYKDFGIFYWEDVLSKLYYFSFLNFELCYLLLGLLINMIPYVNITYTKLFYLMIDVWSSRPMHAHQLLFRNSLLLVGLGLSQIKL
jgi:hypothetical protein